MMTLWVAANAVGKKNLPVVVSFIFLGDIGKTKLIREATLKGHISGSQRGVTILRYGLESPWSQLN